MHLVKSLRRHAIRGCPFLPRFHVMGAVIVLLSPPTSNPCQGQTPPPILSQAATNSASTEMPRPAPNTRNSESHFRYQEIEHLENEGRYDEALAEADAAVKAEPQNIDPYVIRGHLYSEMTQWDRADADFQTILQIDPNNFPAQFNRSEVKLMKKDYDAARSAFLVLENNPDWGDLASYKVFVCDLFADHEDVAKSELDAFNKEGSHPGYYFANATWSFYHKQPQEGQTWVDSAKHIYSRKIVHFYSATLVSCGYIPPPSDDAPVP